MSILSRHKHTVLAILPIENLQEVRGLRGEHRQLCYRCAAIIDGSKIKTSLIIGSRIN